MSWLVGYIKFNNNNIFYLSTKLIKIKLWFRHKKFKNIIRYSYNEFHCDYKKKNLIQISSYEWTRSHGSTSTLINLKFHPYKFKTWPKLGIWLVGGSISWFVGWTGLNNNVIYYLSTKLIEIKLWFQH